MPDLDGDLGRARQDLLAEIHVPELAAVRARAGAVRRRRRGVAGALVALALALGAGSALWPAGPITSPPPAASPTPSATSTVEAWQASGITVWPVSGDFESSGGEIYDVAFATPRVGYALARSCRPGTGCTVSFARTLDAGQTWIPSLKSPFSEQGATSLPRLQVVGPDGIGVVDGATTYFMGRGVGQWTRTDQLPGTDAGTAQHLWIDPPDRSGCVPTAVRVWHEDGSVGTPARQPGLQVCRLAVRAGDGTWWVAGRAGDQPAVGFSRDNGASWSVVRLPAGPPGAWAEVVTRGPEVYASVVSPAEPPAAAVKVAAVYRSVDRREFALYADELGTVVGDIVPLPDGRLLAANGLFLVSGGPGTPLRTAGSALPAAGRIERTPGAWVAYDVFANGYVVTSADGLTWHKINLH